MPERSDPIGEVYNTLLAHYGPQCWWPAESRFEMMLGAVLTQNTAWTNVESAITRLKQAGLLTLEQILGCDQTELADCIRPSGYFNLKAGRLKNLCHCLQAIGLEESLNQPTPALRQILLSVNGIGPETADSILLYAYHRPVFVIDAYTRRLFSRLGLVSGKESYEELRARFERTMGPSAAIYNEYHALIVQHAKQVCRVKPRCSACVFVTCCPSANK